MNACRRLAYLAAALVATGLALAAGRDNQAGAPPPVFRTAVPDHLVDVVLGRPGSDRVTLSVLAHRELPARLVWHAEPDGEPVVGEPRTLPAGTAVELELTGLQPNTAYAWELRDLTGAPVAKGRWHTQRPPGSRFTLTITADSHLDEMTDLALYETTLRNALADHPDFHLDLGDTFMTEKYPGDFHDARAQYLAQRYYFGRIAASAPLFLALGNHDGELGWLRADGTDNIVTWSANLRNALFPNPAPGGLYTGNATPAPGVGLPRNYYAWEWGSVLCVMLDPFWPTTARPSRGNGAWSRTLGEEQYRWLQRTLAASRAPLKLVFIHHLVGGADQNGRGGAEASRYFEWGGQNADDTPGFAARRPGWEQPVHDLLRAAGVAAVFHGHDHFYARQERDGIVYQLLPQPGQRGRRTTNSAASYSYRSGEILSGSGHLRIAVDGDEATVAFVEAILSADERPGSQNGRVAASYHLRPPAPAPR